MTEIKFKQALVQATEQLEADGHHDISTLLNLLFGSLITTIESQKEEIERLRSAFKNNNISLEFNAGLTQILSKENEELKSITEQTAKDKETITHLLKSEAHHKWIAEDKVESLKAITELALKELRWYADKKNWNLGVSISMGSAFPLHEAIKSDKGKRAQSTLSEIERLKNEGS